MKKPVALAFVVVLVGAVTWLAMQWTNAERHAATEREQQTFARGHLAANAQRPVAWTWAPRAGDDGRR